jgi:hypothetical protein
VLTIKPKYGVQVCLKPLEPWYMGHSQFSWKVGLGWMNLKSINKRWFYRIYSVYLSR